MASGRGQTERAATGAGDRLLAFAFRHLDVPFGARPGLRCRGSAPACEGRVSIGPIRQWHCHWASAVTAEKNRSETPSRRDCQGGRNPEASGTLLLLEGQLPSPKAAPPKRCYVVLATRNPRRDGAKSASTKISSQRSLFRPTCFRADC